MTATGYNRTIATGHVGGGCLHPPSGAKLRRTGQLALARPDECVRAYVAWDEEIREISGASRLRG